MAITYRPINNFDHALQQLVIAVEGHETQPNNVLYSSMGDDILYGCDGGNVN